MTCGQRTAKAAHRRRSPSPSTTGRSRAASHSPSLRWQQLSPSGLPVVASSGSQLLWSRSISVSVHIASQTPPGPTATHGLRSPSPGASRSPSSPCLRAADHCPPAKYPSRYLDQPVARTSEERLLEADHQRQLRVGGRQLCVSHNAGSKSFLERHGRRLPGMRAGRPSALLVALGSGEGGASVEQRQGG